MQLLFIILIFLTPSNKCGTAYTAIAICVLSEMVLSLSSDLWCLNPLEMTIHLHLFSRPPVHLNTHYLF